MVRKSSILIVEDDESIAEVLEYNLNREGFETRLAVDGQSGLREIRSHRPDLVVLDLMLPMVDGLEVCRQVRADPATQDLLIMMLTARAEESDQVEGFTAGADDYATKPFSLKVLLKRIGALMRRRDNGADEGNLIVSQGILIDQRCHLATVGENALDLTPTEFALLTTLVRQPGRAYSRSELIDLSLGGDALVLDRTIDVHIRALRKKLVSHAELIQTVRGVGYRLRSPNDVAAQSPE